MTSIKAAQKAQDSNGSQQQARRVAGRKMRLADVLPRRTGLVSLRPVEVGTEAALDTAQWLGWPPGARS